MRLTGGLVFYRHGEGGNDYTVQYRLLRRLPGGGIDMRTFYSFVGAGLRTVTCN